ncbi:MAG: hypothetical protein QXT37_09720 [Thermofilaceae archaeon]
MLLRRRRKREKGVVEEGGGVSSVARGLGLPGLLSREGLAELLSWAASNGAGAVDALLEALRREGVGVESRLEAVQLVYLMALLREDEWFAAVAQALYCEMLGLEGAREMVVEAVRSGAISAPEHAAAGFTAHVEAPVLARVLELEKQVGEGVVDWRA